MRTIGIRWVLALACVALFACGDDADGKGGPGGAGGISDGGSGGDGGDGGDGGAGGGGGGDPEAVCGNGVREAGEECDDGNTFDNDGCSSSCQWEGSCRTPLNFRAMAELDLFNGWRIAEASFAWANSPEVNSCGSESGNRSVVFKYVNGPQRGLLAVGAGPETLAGVSLAVRETCDDAQTELVCQAADRQLHWVRELAPGEEVYFIFDGPDAHYAGGAPFFVGTIFEPFLGEGEECVLEPGAGDAQCGDGLACGEDEWEDTFVCMEDEEPILDQVRAHRDGTRLVVLADGTDEPGNVRWIEAIFKDAAGNVLDFDGYVEAGTALLDPTEKVIGKREFRADWVNARFFTNPTVENAASVSVRLVDGNVNVSTAIEVPIVPIPLVGAGQSCDRHIRENACAEGLECRNGTCG